MDSSPYPTETTTYYYVPGMMYPYWAVYVDGERDYAHNLDSDTDMGDLDVEEFTQMFGDRARVISSQVAHDRTAQEEDLSP